LPDLPDLDSESDAEEDEESDVDMSSVEQEELRRKLREELESTIVSGMSAWEIMLVAKVAT